MQRYENTPKYIDQYPELYDFYNEYDPLEINAYDGFAYDELTSTLSDEEWELLEKQPYYTTIRIKNKTKMPSPVLLKVYFADESTREIRIPAHVWRRNPTQFVKLLISEQPVEKVILDPYLETADANLDDNVFPQQIGENYFYLVKPPEPTPNPMQKQKELEEREKEEIED